MKSRQHNKVNKKVRSLIRRALNNHDWATKTELQHFVSGKPDLQILPAN